MRPDLRLRGSGAKLPLHAGALTAPPLRLRMLSWSPMCFGAAFAGLSASQLKREPSSASESSEVEIRRQSVSGSASVSPSRPRADARDTQP